MSSNNTGEELNLLCSINPQLAAANPLYSYMQEAGQMHSKLLAGPVQELVRPQFGPR